MMSPVVVIVSFLLLCYTERVVSGGGGEEAKVRKCGQELVKTIKAMCMDEETGRSCISPPKGANLVEELKRASELYRYGSESVFETKRSLSRGIAKECCIRAGCKLSYMESFCCSAKQRAEMKAKRHS